MKRVIGILALCALVGIGLWFSLAKHGESVRASQEGPVVAASQASHTADAAKVQVRRKRPPLQFQPSSPERKFVLADEHQQPNEAEGYSQARQISKVQWDKFLAEAHPSADQQQAILSAIYDAELYAAEVHKMEDDWARDTVMRPEAENPSPDVHLYREIADQIGARAQEVLTPEQYRSYRHHFDAATGAAVEGGFVAPVH